MNKITNSTKISQQANKFYIKYLGMKKKRILRKKQNYNKNEYTKKSLQKPCNAV